MSKCSRGKLEFPGRAKVFAKSRDQCNKVVGWAREISNATSTVGSEQVSEARVGEDVSVGTGFQMGKTAKTENQNHNVDSGRDSIERTKKKENEGRRTQQSGYNRASKHRGR